MSDFHACKYHLTEDGEIESRIFRYPREVPKGWTGDRGKLKKEAAKIKAKAEKAKAGRAITGAQAADKEGGRAS